MCSLLSCSLLLARSDPMLMKLSGLDLNCFLNSNIYQSMFYNAIYIYLKLCESLSLGSLVANALTCSWLAVSSLLSLCFSSSCSWSMDRRDARLVFMLVVMVTNLSDGGVASLTPLSLSALSPTPAPATSAWSLSSSDTFRQSLTHLQQS